MTDQHCVLVVEDDPEMRGLLRRCFEDGGFAVLVAGDTDEARPLLASHRVDLVTLDIVLGEDHEGRAAELLGREIRDRHDCGIIMVSGKATRASRLAWLEDWADDNIQQPFDAEDMLARARAVLRRRRGNGHGDQARPTPGGVARFAGWMLDMRTHDLTGPDGVIVQLTWGEFNLLSAFLRNANEVLSRERIVEMDGTIHSVGALDRAVDMRVHRLRSKLGMDEEGAPDLIRTMRGAGYKFAAEIEWS